MRLELSNRLRRRALGGAARALTAAACTVGTELQATATVDARTHIRGRAPGGPADAGRSATRLVRRCSKTRSCRQLIATALAQNYDLRIAASRILAGAGAARRSRAPTSTRPSRAGVDVQGAAGPTVALARPSPLAGSVRLGLGCPGSSTSGASIAGRRKPRARSCGERMGPPRGRHQPRQPGRHALLRAARARSPAGDLERTCVSRKSRCA